jgi:site-specific DNA-methyltransferase (adenine-specific)
MRGRYQTNYLTGPGKRNGESGKAWRGFDPTSAGRHWAVPKSLRKFLPKEGDGMSSHAQLEALYQQDLIIFPQKAGGQPMYKQYIGPGVYLQDIWAFQPNTRGVLFDSDECIDEDVKYLEDDAEKLGYPTQKPVGLLERIIQTSSDKGDLVLDPFCGCGTTIDAAEKLGRKWIGIDITQLATSLIKNRLRDTYGDKIEIVTIGEPTTPNEAATLAEEDKYQFQWWALGLVGARPVEQKKGADHGIDGKILFRDDPESGKPEQIIIQVKGGKTGVKDVRDLRGVLDREKAAIGILISLQEATGPMETEAASVGFYEHKMNQQKFPRLQLRTVKELMEGKGIERPTRAAASDETFKKAPKSKKKDSEQTELGV